MLRCRHISCRICGAKAGFGAVKQFDGCCNDGGGRLKCEERGIDVGRLAAAEGDGGGGAMVTVSSTEVND
jgi:hypothetical protein|tara:strand:+ start:214 stop:423 length:210 start_codon:yes stop_codon:yes gene_type:complete